jgi:hypothetical protein
VGAPPGAVDLRARRRDKIRYLIRDARARRVKLSNIVRSFVRRARASERGGTPCLRTNYLRLAVVRVCERERFSRSYRGRHREGRRWSSRTRLRVHVHVHVLSAPATCVHMDDVSYLILSYLILSYLSGGTRMTRGNKKPTPFYFCVVALEQKVALQPHLPVPVRCPASHGCTAEPHASPCLPLGVRP